MLGEGIFCEPGDALKNSAVCMCTGGVGKKPFLPTRVSTLTMLNRMCNYACVFPCDRSLVVKNTPCFNKFTILHIDLGQPRRPKLDAQHNKLVKT